MTTEKQTHAMTLMRVMAAVTALLPFVRFFMRSSAAMWVFYIVLGIMCVATIIELEKYPAGLRTSRLTICFLAICAISICFSLHWRQFMAWQRLGAFILLLFAVGPVVQTRFISRMKRRALGYIGWICVLCALYYNGLYVFMIVHYCSWLSPYSWVFDYSMSISMLFGALSAIGSIYTAWLLLSLRWKRNNDKSVLSNRRALTKGLFILAAFIISFNSLILTSSRSAIVSFVAALLVMCAMRWIRSRRVPWVGCVATLAVAGFSCLSVVVPMTPNMEVKLSNVEANNDDYLASRRDLWSDRSQEIQKFRVFGTGFGCVDESSTHSYKATTSKFNYSIDPQDGIIEPGSSWMYVLSATGIPGFIIFTLLLAFVFLGTLRGKGLLAGLLCFFAIHMMAEGYVLSSGSVMTYIFWLTMACAFPYTNKRDKLWRAII